MKNKISVFPAKRIILFSGISFLIPFCLISCREKTIERPNILWIIAEDLSPDIGCYGNTIVNTPALDAMARSGVRFTNVFTTAPVCTPSRTALALGMHQTSVNAHHQRYPEELKNTLPENVLPINEILRRNGYQTANIRENPGTGKTDWSFKSEFSGYDHSRWDDFTQNQPFFAVVNLRLTHRPFERDTVHPIDPGRVSLPPYYPDHMVARKDWAQYLESVQLMDGEVQMVLDKIKEKGYADNTIVFFFGDHGRPFTRAKTFLYDSGLKIPLIIVCPENLKWHEYLPERTVNDRMISAIDITATTLSIAGIPKPAYMQGRVMFGPDEEPPAEYIYSAMDRMGEIFFRSRTVRSDRFRYIRNFHYGFSVNAASTANWKATNPIFHLIEFLEERNQLDPIQKKMVLPVPPEELYDIRKDPFELDNLAADPAYFQELEHMRRQLDAWQEEVKDYGMLEDSPELKKYFLDYGIESSALNGPAEKKIRDDVLFELNKSN
jgi:N-sulfoglucosamine sulfohydrolase